MLATNEIATQQHRARRWRRLAAFGRSGMPSPIPPPRRTRLRHRGRPERRGCTVWASSAEWQSPATVTEHVRRLRRKLELDPASPTIIETVPGVGYRIGATRPTAFGVPQVVDGDQAIVLVEGTMVVFASTAVADVLGVADAAAIEGRDVFEFVAPESVEAVRARHECAFAGAWPRPEVVTLLTATGERVEVELSSTPVQWGETPVSQVTMWPADASRSLRERVTGITTDVQDAVIILAPDLTISSWSSGAEHLYGWTEHEVLGRPFLEVVPIAVDSETSVAVLAEFAATGRWFGKMLQHTRSGGIVLVRATATMLRDDEGRSVGVVTVIRRAESPMADRHDVGLDLLADLRRGVEADELEVHYQPTHDLWSGAVIGVEALARWQHPRRGLLLPDELIPAAERANLLGTIGMKVFETACTDWRRLRDLGHALSSSVNVSGRQLGRGDLARSMRAVIDRTGVPAHELWVEVTETALVEDLVPAERSLRELHEIGVQIAIDDFGTGWASLTYLHHFPADALKIDRLFVAGLGIVEHDTAIVRSILSLGEELDLGVVAEGIETVDQLLLLRGLGCSQGQGFLFAPAMPVGDLERVLERRRSPRLVAAGTGVQGAAASEG